MLKSPLTSVLKQNKRTVNFRRKYLLPQITSTKWDKKKSSILKQKKFAPILVLP